MKLEKKRSPYGNLENNSFALQIESKIMDLNLKRRDLLKSLINGNLNNREYVETLFSIYDVSFESDYSDLSEFTGMKVGNLNTSVVASYDENIEDLVLFKSFNRISYTVLSNICLNHEFTKEELRKLVLEEKVILLKRNECDITTTKALDMISDSDFKCLSDYDFNDLDNNTTLHNDLVVGYTRSTFDTPVVRELEKEYTSSLRNELHDLRRSAKSVKNMLSDRIKSVEGLERLCQEKLKQLCILVNDVKQNL